MSETKMQHSLTNSAVKRIEALRHWRPRRPGREPVDIRAMISPLRYDIQIRLDFFDEFATTQPRDPAEVATLAWDGEYGRWFRDIAMARYRPWVLRDPVLTFEQFSIRVRTALELFDSISQKGFSTDRPIQLHLATARARSECGATLRPRLHSGDGSHRLAILAILQGHLQPDQYVVRSDSRTLLDNTVRLFGPEQAESPEYLGFVARHWSTEAVTSLAELDAAVERDGGPDALAEARGILESHRQAWRAAPNA